MNKLNLVWYKNILILIMTDMNESPIFLVIMSTSLELAKVLQPSLSTNENIIGRCNCGNNNNNNTRT